MNWRICNLKDFEKAQAEHCFALAEPARREQLQKMGAERRAASLCGEWMAKQMLSAQSGIPLESLRLLRTEKGKPFAENCPLHFNISHSGDWVACAVSSRPIGIDIEQMRQPDLKIARRLCTPEELAWLAPDEPDAPCRLLQIWTAKEAYFKWKGSGITDLKSISLFELQPHLQQQETADYVLAVYQE